MRSAHCMPSLPVPVIDRIILKSMGDTIAATLSAK
jgi:hypothetical protein